MANFSLQKRIIIATGSKPRKLKLDGVDQVRYFDNENILHINQLTKKLLVVGDGPIGMEMAQAMQRLGNKVTVIEEGNGKLVHDDKTLTSILLQRLRKKA